MRPGLAILAVRDGTGEVTIDQRHGFERDAIGHGMIAGHAQGLERVNKGVDAGCGSQRGRQAECELGIGDDERG